MTDYYEIDFLQVGEKKSGDAIAIRYEVGGETFIHVTDGGYQKTGPTLAEHIRKYYGNPSHIDHVVLTHHDGDHAGGLQTILEEFDVGKLWMLRPWDYVGELMAHFETYNSAEHLERRLRKIYPNINTLEEIANHRGIEICEPYQGKAIGAFTVLAPSLDRYIRLIAASEKTPESETTEEQSNISTFTETVIENAKELLAKLRAAAWGEEVFSTEETSIENEMSIVQFARLCDRTIVLTGDVGRSGLAEAAEFTPNVGLVLPGVDNFQIPHHGSRRNVSTPILDRWLGTALPQKPEEGNETFTAIVSASKNDPDHPRKTVLRAFMHRGAKILGTDVTGQKYIFKNIEMRDGWTATAPFDYPEEMEE